MDYDDLPTPKFPDELIDEDLCLIDGEKHPLIIGKIVKMIREGEQPRILVLADPGHGKTWFVGWLAEKLHELELFQGDFEVEKQMKWDPFQFVKTARRARNQIICHPDVNTSFASDEFRSKGNRSNRDIIYLSRRFGNILIYDGHELGKCDKTIRTNHNIRVLSVGKADTYRWKVQKIIRPNDSRREKDEKTKPLGTVKAEKPSEETRQHIESMDNEKKDEKLAKREKEWKDEKEKGNTSLPTPG